MDWKNYGTRMVDLLMGGRIAPLMTLLMAALLANSAAQLTWMMLPYPAEESPPSGVIIRSIEPPRLNAETISRDVIARHIFGVVRNTAMDQADAVIPETSLTLQLRGVVASDDAEIAMAIVAGPDGKENYYTIGKELPGGAVLKEVHPQNIVISRGGRLETVRLPEDKINLSQLTGPVSKQGGPAVAPEAGQLLQQYRDQFLQDPQSLTNLLQGEPYWENSRLLGYRLRPGRDTGALAKFGIQAGDVVTSVNGTSLADPAGRMELLRNIANTTELNLVLMRNGQPISITIPVGKRG